MQTACKRARVCKIDISSAASRIWNIMVCVAHRPIPRSARGPSRSSGRRTCRCSARSQRRGGIAFPWIRRPAPPSRCYRPPSSWRANWETVIEGAAAFGPEASGQNTFFNIKITHMHAWKGSERYWLPRSGKSAGCSACPWLYSTPASPLICPQARRGGPPSDEVDQLRWLSTSICVGV